jgi:hypothetical protein
MLTELLRNMPARRIVLVLDACQSGATIDTLKKVGWLKMRQEEAMDRIDVNGPQGNHPAAFYIVAASSTLQLAGQPRNGPSLLVDALIKSMTAGLKPGGARVSMRKVIASVWSNISTGSEKAGLGFTPLPFGIGRDFLIVGRPQK